MDSDHFTDPGVQTVSELPSLLEDFTVGTQTIDLNSLFSRDVTSSGSFDIRGIQQTTLAKLLNALPIPGLLLGRSHAIVFANDACDKFAGDHGGLLNEGFLSLFVRNADIQNVGEHLTNLSDERKPQVLEALVGKRNPRIWGRVHIRSLRMADERFTLVLIEDLSAEKKQVLLSKRFSESLQKAHDELEIRVRQRTSELSQVNKELTREVAVRRTAEESLNLAANVIANSNEAIMVTDPSTTIVEVNEAFCEVTGFQREDVLGKNPRIMASGRHDKDFWKQFWTTVGETGQWKGEVWDRRKTGELFPKLLSVSAIKDRVGRVTHYVGIFSDISRIKQTEARLQRLAHYDPLTELPNRLLFRDRLHQALVRAQRGSTMVAVIFLDLDEFKNINDTLGHQAGDELLVQVAGTVRQCLRRGDTASRMGGDEFTVVMPDLSDPQHARVAAQRIMDALTKPFVLSSHEVFTSASIGISVYPHDGSDADQLLQNADTAMYHAKHQGKNNVQFFSKKMNTELTKLVQAEMTLRKAMESQSLLVYYQPLISCRTQEIVGAEALLRLRNEDGEVVSGGFLIPVAEERGLIVSLGDWVLKSACAHRKKLWDSGLANMRVAVNVSMRQVRHPGWVDTVLRVLDRVDCDPSFLELELTESTLMMDVDLAVQRLNRLRQHGVRVAVDDFGTGYSSLSYLSRLPVDKLKIDKSFIDMIHEEPTQRALVQAMIHVAHSLEMSVTAEGVESMDQLHVLKDLGCDTFQGYLFAPALSPVDLESVLRSHKNMLQRPEHS